MPEWNTLPIDGDDLIDATVTVPKLAPLAAAAPAVAGQVLVATSPTTWAWVDPPSGGTPTSVKTACRLLAFSNVALTGLAGIDGVVPNGGDRILCVGQTPGTQNGIYVAAAGAWSRAPDANTDAEVMAGLFTFVTEGTQFGDTGWVLTTNDPIVLDTTALVFAQFSGTGTAIAGNGLTRTGNTFDVVASADGSIVVGPDSVAVGVLNTDAQHGVRGGGTQHALAGAAAGFMSPAQVTKLAGIADGAEVVTAGAGLTKTGSTLNVVAGDASIVVSADSIAVGSALAGAGLTKAGVGLDVVAADGSIVVAADSVRVGVLQTDAMHGNRGGGSLHPPATVSVDGFMTMAQVAKLDSPAEMHVGFNVAGTQAYTVPAGYRVVGAWLRPGAGGGSGGGGGGMGASTSGTAGGGGGSGGRAGYSAALAPCPLDIGPGTALTITVGAGGTAGAGGSAGSAGAGGSGSNGQSGGNSIIAVGLTTLVETRLGVVPVSPGIGLGGGAGNAATPGVGAAIETPLTTAFAQKWGHAASTATGSPTPNLPGTGGSGGNSADGVAGAASTLGTSQNFSSLFGRPNPVGPANGGAGGTLASTRGGGGGGGAGASAYPGDEVASVLGEIPNSVPGIGGVGGTGGGAAAASGAGGGGGADGAMGRGGGGGAGGGGGRANTGTGFQGGAGGAGGVGSAGGVILVLARQ